MTEPRQPPRRPRDAARRDDDAPGSPAQSDASGADDNGADMRLVTRIIASRRPGGSHADADRAWNELLTAHSDRLFAVCVRMVRDHDTARDLTQDALVRIVQHIESYDGRARLSTWMIRITMNVCLSHMRKQRLRRHASLDAPLGHDPSNPAATGASTIEQTAEPSAHNRVEYAEKRRVLLAAMEALEPDHKAVLTLRDVRGLDYREIADVLDVPVGTVKSRLFRARSALRDAIEAISPSDFDAPRTATPHDEDL